MLKNGLQYRKNTMETETADNHQKPITINQRFNNKPFALPSKTLKRITAILTKLLKTNLKPKYKIQPVSIYFDLELNLPSLEK